MTSISSTTVTTHHKHHKVTPQAQTETSAAANPAADALARTSGTSDSSSTSGSTSGVSIDKLLSQVIDLLQKLQASTGGESLDDGDGDQEGGVERMVAEMDSNQDGIVTTAEFVAARPSDVSEEQAATLFQSFDTQGTGSLSVADLTEAMKRDGHPHPDAPGGSNDLFSSLDTNGDGTISRDEFSAGFQSAQQSRDNDIAALLRLLGGKEG